MANKIVVGVFGAGRIGKLHVDNLLHRIPGVVVKKVVDVYPEPAKEWAAERGLPLSDDPADIIDDPDIQAVLVCTSTDTHADLIVRSARAGKDVFTEKPIDLDLARIREVLGVIEETGVKFQVGFNRRFDHNHKAVRDAVAAGKVGKVHVIKVTSRDPAPPPVEYVRRSGGLFLDMMIHDLDMACYMAGPDDPVEEVYAVGGVLVDPAIGEAGDVDTAVVTLKFESGAMAVIDNSRQAVYGYDQRVEVFGSGGMVLDDNDFPNNARVYTKEETSADKIHWFFLQRYNESYVSELEAFFESLRIGSEPIAGGKDGLNAVLLAMAAQKSLDEHRPVKVSEIENH
ncbi:MAG: inositol 2-dehydrogenase [Promethearchaeota archaeon]